MEPLRSSRMSNIYFDFSHTCEKTLTAPFHWHVACVLRKENCVRPAQNGRYFSKGLNHLGNVRTLLPTVLKSVACEVWSGPREMGCTVGFGLETPSRTNVILGFRKRALRPTVETERHLSVTHLRWMSACLLRWAYKDGAEVLSPVSLLLTIPRGHLITQPPRNITSLAINYLDTRAPFYSSVQFWFRWRWRRGRTTGRRIRRTVIKHASLGPLAVNLIFMAAHLTPARGWGFEVEGEISLHTHLTNKD